MNVFKLIDWVTLTVVGHILGQLVLQRFFFFQLLSQKTYLYLLLFWSMLISWVAYGFILVMPFWGVWLFVIGMFAIESIFILTLRWYREHSFHKNVLTFLNECVLNLNCGLSLRQSFVALKPQFKKSFDITLIVDSIHSNRFFEVERSLLPEAANLYRELIKLLEENHKLMERLLMIRDFYRSRYRIKEKIKTAAQGPKSQLITISMIYLGLFFFQIYRQNLKDYMVLLFISVLIFLGGLLLFFYVSHHSLRFDPLVFFLRDILYKIESGVGLSTALKQVITQLPNSQLKQDLEYWFLKIVSSDGGNTGYRFYYPKLNQVVALLGRGLKGEMISKPLRQMTIDFQEQWEWDHERRVASLQLRLMVILILFFLPAFMILLLCPVLLNLMNEVQYSFF